MRRDASLKLWQFLAKGLNAGQKMALLVVAESIGSSPGRAGFKMAIDETGALCGSIGGGIMEIKLVELAKARLKSSQSEVLLKRQIHQKTARQDQSGMICSGEQSIIFLQLERKDLVTVRAILRSLKNHQTAVLQITPQGLQLLKNRKSEEAFHFKRLANQSFVFEENIGFKNQLYIIGGGHCALALSELMSKFDFYIRLYDDRPDLNTFVKNRFVHEKHLLESYEQISDNIPSGSHVFVVVMTVGYRSDEMVIRQLLPKRFRYFGVLGSAAKMKTLLDQLHSEGIPGSQLAQLHTPIGLKINSRTPEEIALSIAAEMIRVKNTSIDDSA